MDDCKVECKEAVFEDKGRAKVCQRVLPEMTQLLNNLGGKIFSSIVGWKENQTWRIILKF